MDVRCEKCQTEYELDEARLKPGGVTVKCTNCGHMFKIRKRANTNVGAPTTPVMNETSRPRTQSNKPVPAGPAYSRADSILDDAPTAARGEDGPTTVDRQWLIRLENGEQKSCRELATLQQWIVACVVSRESLISRSGKTWKRLGDIAELAQYFDIADEARTTRDERRASPTGKQALRGTMMGVGGPTAAGGTILPDDDDGRTTGPFQSQPGARRPITQPPPLPGKVPVRATTPPMGSNASTPLPPSRPPLTTPPPPPPKRESSGPVMMAEGAVPNLKGPPPDGRATAGWATDHAASGAGPSNRVSQPFVGKLSGMPEEPAFAGKVRVGPPDSESSFDTGRVRSIDDDEDLLPRRRGSSLGLIILFMVLIVGGGTAALVYFLVIKKDDDKTAKATADAALLAQTPDATPIVTPVIDASDAPPMSVVETARHELAADNEVRMKTALESLAGKDDAPANAVRALLGLAIAQDQLDRATLVADKAEADKLRKDSKQLALDAGTSAQKAYKVAADDPAANVALAHVLRLQGKPAKEVKRYLDAAKAKPGDWAREVALAEALLLARDSKLDDAKTAFAAIDSGDGKLETSNDVRARFHLALIALAQSRASEAKPLVDQVLAAQPDHAGARALAAKLETVVANTDPLPPEDPGKGSGSAKPPGPGPGPGPDLGGDYDGLVRKGDTVANSSCTKAIEYYTKALEKKPNGVEALAGLGYCHLDAKNFASAQSRFRTALSISSRYEPALAGIAEAYQQQGRKDDAIAAWRRYLEAYPGAKKATAALERLGVTGDAPPPAGSNAPQGSGTEPTPTPTPPPAGSGSGSG
ncbi:MAG: zinc-ribbon domain-containing protein [Kofleriaceae bacterium]